MTTTTAQPDQQTDHNLLEDYDQDYYEFSEAQLSADKLYNGVDGCGISRAVNPIAILNRIVGGDETAANEFPWVVGISFNYREVFQMGRSRKCKLAFCFWRCKPLGCI